MKRLLIASLALLLPTLALQAQTSPAAAPAAPAPATDSTQPSATAFQSIDPAKAAEIRKMLDLTGTSKLMKKMIDQALASYQAKNPNISPDFWVHLNNDISTGDLIDKMIPLYDKYYSIDDLKAMNAFYQSPAGQRVLTATPLIMSESMQVGQEWGKAMTMRVIAELEKEKAKTAPATNAAPANTTPPGPGH